jgi:DNA-binding PucR family transcriptional regulator
VKIIDSYQEILNVSVWPKNYYKFVVSGQISVVFYNQDMIGVTLKDILALPLLKNASVITGDTSLDRYVTGITVAEVPDIVSWAKKNTIYLSTLFAFKTDEELRALVRGLHLKGAAALFVKPRRFYQEIPSSLIEEAKKLGFPVVEIEEKIKWSDIIRAVLEKIIEESLAQKKEFTLARALLEGDFEDVEDEFYQYLNLKPGQPFALVLIEFENQEANASPSSGELDYTLKQIFRQFSPDHLFFRRKNSYFIFFPSIRLKNDSFDKVIVNISENFAVKVSLYLFEKIFEPKEIPTAAKKIVNLSKIIRKFDLKESFYRVEDFEHLLLLNSLLKLPETETFLARFKEDLINKAGKTGSKKLLLTVSAYVCLDFNKTKTAHKLNIHFNTVKYRLKRFEDITGLHLHKTEDLFKVYLLTTLLKLKGEL